MKKILMLALAAIVTFAAVSVAYANTDSVAKSYTDIKSTNWAYDSVNAMSQKGIVKGYPDGSFKPNNTITYGQFIKMALIASTSEDVGNSTTGNWALNYYNKAVDLKYFSQIDIEQSKLNEKITRGDMALIISNILGDTKIENYDTLDASITDVDSTTKNDYDIVKAYATGILTGYDDGTFKPNGTLTRAESVTVIYRLIDESKRVLPGEKKENKETSTVTFGTDIGSVIQNYKTFEQIKEAEASDSDFMEATRYEYITDMSGYKVTLRENMGTKWIEINGQTPLNLGWGNMYLMKDDKIVMFTQDGIYDDENRMTEHLDITTIEYFVFPNYKSEQVPYVKGVGQISHVIGIMPNPLYVK